MYNIHTRINNKNGATRKVKLKIGGGYYDSKDEMEQHELKKYSVFSKKL
jgi:hypothetical protein